MTPVRRLGLATRGNTRLPADSVVEAVERGVNYLNWCGYDDGIRADTGVLDLLMIREMVSGRDDGLLVFPYFAEDSSGRGLVGGKVR